MIACAWLPLISGIVCAIRRPCWRTARRQWKHSIGQTCPAISLFLQKFLPLQARLRDVISSSSVHDIWYLTFVFKLCILALSPWHWCALNCHIRSQTLGDIVNSQNTWATDLWPLSPNSDVALCHWLSYATSYIWQSSIVPPLGDSVLLLSTGATDLWPLYPNNATALSCSISWGKVVTFLGCKSKHWKTADSQQT